MASHRITITLEEDHYIGLGEMAADQGKGLSDVARDAITEYLLTQHWGRTIGDLAMRLIKKGMTNAEVLKEVRSNFPHAKTSSASVAWYRSKLRKEDSSVPTDAEAKFNRSS